MKPIRIRSIIKGDFGKAFSEMKNPMAVRATTAIDRLGNAIKTIGRANIAAAGFSKRWQNALRVNRYPRKGVSISPALWIYHAISYAEVFESGATIHGKPLLWIPLSSTPKKIGGRRMTPKLYTQEIGPLTAISPPGHPPLLVAKYQGRSGRKKISLAGLRRGQSGDGSKTSVPIFVGLERVKLRKRFRLRSIFVNETRQLKRYYDGAQ